MMRSKKLGLYAVPASGWAHFVVSFTASENTIHVKVFNDGQLRWSKSGAEAGEAMPFANGDAEPTLGDVQPEEVELSGGGGLVCNRHYPITSYALHCK